MNTKLFLAALALSSTAASAQTIKTTFAGDTAIVTVTNPTKYLILPVEENRPEAQVLLDNGKKTDTWMDVRLAVSKTDYSVPFELSKGKKAVVKIVGLAKDAQALKELKLSDTFDTRNTDYYRPVYHHTPLYGWMNDANGLTYKDGEYHLYFQYNPYGSKWGNMHWGHSVSRDLVHWQHLDPAIARDPMGHIFSGSTVVDTRNSAGFGKNTIVAFYTSHSVHDGKQVQVQCMAYSKDDGRTFIKYKNNPVVTPFDGLENFRDPKIFWYEPTRSWYMIVSADKNMRFYQSKNLKQWKYVSQWGEGFGAQPNQFECPDFFPLPVDGDKNNQKYVMIVNINPGFVFGGSATQYFVGEFDGKEFKCDSKPSTVKWLDWGKDHYATVTFSNLGERIVAVPWMSNWQYANVTPIQQNRGANALPRELKLFSNNGEVYMSANVVDEARKLRKQTKELGSVSVDNANPFIKRGLFAGNDGAFELEADVAPENSDVVGISLYNDKEERTVIYLDLKQKRIVMDRSESGLTDFGKRAERHDIEKRAEAAGEMKGKLSQDLVVNYKNDFALGTWAPLSLCGAEKRSYHLDIFVDKCSVELFVDGGRIAMTNLVFPTAPYNNIKVYAEGGKSEVKNMKVYKLGL
ncbi:GH32 C-terminal domain-containing protein [Leyella stercorea]|uniref:GH32 C-terminal domain-containing protein n=1 Tax=Leyella stercorea TaxID=363265 RepID=UPI00242BB460|nr:GH32 C-terminal domain-containing protein [Leyella stercorea]